MSRGRVVAIVALVVLLIAPYFVEEFWLQTGLFCMAAAIAAIGLTLLVGITGQLSLAHAFFIAIGAYGYSFLAGESSAAELATPQPDGLGLPPLLAAVGAVALAGLAGLIISPIAGRLRGIYLGLASVGLVFIGQHILFNATGITGGFNGRDAEPFSIAGFTFADSDPDLVVGGVPFQALERLWYLGILFVALAWWYARNLINSRPGRALQQVRDSEVAAAVMGVNVPLYKGAAFTISSMYAGLGGVFLALCYQRIVPDTFDFLYSIDFLVMIVIGGLGSVGGAVAGAVVITALPQVLSKYSGSLPLVADPGAGGLQAEEATRFLYGAAVVLILIFAPRGLAGLIRRAPPKPKTTATPAPQPKESTA